MLEAVFIEAPATTSDCSSQKHLSATVQIRVGGKQVIPLLLEQVLMDGGVVLHVSTSGSHKLLQSILDCDAISGC